MTKMIKLININLLVLFAMIFALNFLSILAINVFN